VRSSVKFLYFDGGFIAGFLPTFFSVLTMKLRSQLASALVFLYAVITLPAAPNNSNNHNTINAVLGDVSFVKKFGKAPNEATNERLRIQTHLAYVEALLRKADVSHLSPTLRERRAALLDKLHDYRLAGEFPTNLDFPQERRPCFIDAAGNICAVGYLIKQTAGRALAERITAAHKYDFLADMQMPELSAWVEASGLTARECAMIQPGYQEPFFGGGLDTNFTFDKPSIQLSAATGFNNTTFWFNVEINAKGIPATSATSDCLNGSWVECSIERDSAISDKFYGPVFRFGAINTTRCGITVSANSNRFQGRLQFQAALDLRGKTSIEYFIRLVHRQNNGRLITSFYTTAMPVTISINPVGVHLDNVVSIPISPNPTNDVCMLTLPENELHRVRLTNSLGTAVATLSEAAGTTALDVSALAAGIYFVEVESRTTRRRWVQKMVKY